jgi:hypothetical protein
MGYIVVLQLIAFFECTDEDWVILGRYESDCIRAQRRCHFTVLSSSVLMEKILADWKS